MLYFIRRCGQPWRRFSFCILNSAFASRPGQFIKDFARFAGFSS